MTQIIGLLTEDYVLMASDRMITYLNESGEVGFRDDETCKLVNFRNVAGIGYSGIAEVDGHPTHEWIALTLAKHNCQTLKEVTDVLREKASSALKEFNPKFRALEIFISGWAHLKIRKNELGPHFVTINNCYDNAGKYLSIPRDEFETRLFILQESQPLLFKATGSNLTDIRQRRFYDDVVELVSQNKGASEVLYRMISEIIMTSIIDASKTVGSSILSMCIPKRAAIESYKGGFTQFVASEPNTSSASFHFFERGYSELVQYGPAFVGGGIAVTNVETVNDPNRDYQKSSVKILYMPEKKNN